MKNIIYIITVFLILTSFNKKQEEIISTIPVFTYENLCEDTGIVILNGSNLFMKRKKNGKRGRCRIKIDGVEIASYWNSYNSTDVYVEKTLELENLTKGIHTVTFQSWRGGVTYVDYSTKFTYTGNTDVTVSGNENNYCVGEEIFIKTTTKNEPYNYVNFFNDINGNINTNQNKIYNYTLNNYNIWSGEGLKWILTNEDIGENKYYYQYFNGYYNEEEIFCKGDFLKIQFDVHAKPNNLEIETVSEICFGEEITFSAGAENATYYKFYKNENATIAFNSLLNTLTLNQEDYSIGSNSIWVQAKNEFCETDLMKIDFIVNEKPNNLTWSGDTVYCTEDTVLIIPSANGNNISYQWAYDINFNSLVEPTKIEGNNLSFVADNPGTITYYLRAINEANCSTEIKEIPIKINQGVSNLQVTNQNEIFCFGEEITFSAGAENATSYKFYKNASATILISNGNSLTLSQEDYTIGNNSIWVQATNSNNCNSELLEIKFTVNESPNNLTWSGDTIYCEEDTVLIIPSANGNNISYQWAYDINFNSLVEPSKIEGNNLSFVADNPGTTTYYLRAINEANCFTDTESIYIKINEGVSNLQVTNQNGVFCFGEEITFEAGAENATYYKFYKNENATIAFNGSGNSLTLSQEDYTIGNNSIWVQATNSNNCTSALLEIKFTVNEKPNNLTWSGDTIYCEEDAVLIIPSANGNNISYQWAYDINFNSLVEPSKIEGNNLSFVANIATSTTYYLRAINEANCFTDTESIYIKINEGVSNLQVTNQNGVFCFGEEITFEAGAENATYYKFYKNENATIAFNGSGNSLTLSQEDYTIGNNSIWVQATNSNNCTSALLEIKFTVNESPNNLTWSGDTVYCRGENILIIPSANGNNTSYQWAYDANFNNLVDNSKIEGNNLSFVADNPGTTTYYIRAINEANCSTEIVNFDLIIKVEPTNLEVKKITNPNNTIFCKGSIEEYIASGNNVSEFIWYENQELTNEVNSNFISGNNNNKLKINTSILEIGHYTYYLTGTNINGCQTDPILINFQVIENVGETTIKGQNQEVCLNDILNVELENSNENTTYQWFFNSNGTNPINPLFISNNGATLNLDTSISGIGVFNIYFKAINSNGCESELISINYIVNEIPSNIGVSNNNIEVCKGEEIIFNASGNNVDLYKWYKNEALTLIAEPEYVSGTKEYRLTIATDNLDSGIYSYYLVGTNDENCNSEVLEVQFEILDIPNNTTIVAENDYCLNQTSNFTLINDNAISFIWFYDSNELLQIENEYLNYNGSVLSLNNQEVGEHIIYFKAINESGCKSEIQSITYNVLEAPSDLEIVQNQTRYCIGEDIEIIVGANNVSEFIWYENQNGTILLDSELTNGILNERYQPTNLEIGEHVVYFKAINESGCESELQTISFEVLDIPAIINFYSPTQYQIGESIVLELEAENYNKYKVLKNNVPIISNNGDFIEGNIANINISNYANSSDQGLYTIVVSNGFCIVKKDLYIYVFENEIKISHNKEEYIKEDENGEMKVVLEQHSNILFSINISNPVYLVEWNFGDGFYNFGTSKGHYYNNEGEYKVTAKIVNNNTNDFIIKEYPIPFKIIDSNAIEIDNFNPTNDSFSLYPIPIKDYLKLRFNTEEIVEVKFVIYNQYGLIVFAENFNSQIGEQIKIFNNPLFNSPDGIYFAHIIIGKEPLKIINLIKKQ